MHTAFQRIYYARQTSQLTGIVVCGVVVDYSVAPCPGSSLPI